MEACDLRAISLDDKGVKIDRKVCNNCGRCVDVCAEGAMTMYGKEMSVDEVIAEVERDRLYYQNTGGGVTASGGEPLSQADFVVALFDFCKNRGIHAALDTSGYAAPDTLAKVLELTDLVLFDLKLMDSAVHQKTTGVSNELILSNARLVTERRVPVIFRIPLVPGINDYENQIKSIARFIANLGGATQIDLLPYHRLGSSKYEMLDRDYQLAGLLPPPPENVEKLKRIIEGFGFICNVGG